MMSGSTKNKKRHYTKDQFSDKEVYNQIKDQIKQIRDRNLKQVEEDSLINNLYETKKKQMKIKRIRNNQISKPKVQREKDMQQLGEQDSEEGQIKKHAIHHQQQHQNHGIASIQLNEQIKSIVLTRNKVGQIFKARKLEDVIKGFFIRYKSQDKEGSYVIGLVVGVFEGQKQYAFNNARTKILLRTQQGRDQVVKVQLDKLSNNPTGSLEITKWLQANRNKHPNLKEIKQKKQQLNNLMYGKINTQQIDENLLKLSEKASNQPGVPQNINQLLHFMEGQIIDARMKLEEAEFSKQKSDLIALKTKRLNQRIEIHKKLFAKVEQIRIKQKQQFQEEKQRKKKEQSKNYAKLLTSDRKQDHIRQIYHHKINQLCTPKGLNLIIEELKQAHNSFEIQIDI